MKFIVAFAFLIVAVSAQTTVPSTSQGRHLLEVLEKRAEALLASAKSVIASHKSTHSHLLEALEHQVKAVEQLDAEIKKALAEPGRVHHLHHVHVIEERILYLENRVGEEIYAINHATDPNHPPKPETVEQIVARAEKLISQAKEAIAKKPHGAEVGDIERELIILNALVSAVKAKPSPADLKKESEEITRQEKSLEQLIEKLNSRHN